MTTIIEKIQTNIVNYKLNLYDRNSYQNSYKKNKLYALRALKNVYNCKIELLFFFFFFYFLMLKDII